MTQTTLDSALQNNVDSLKQCVSIAYETEQIGADTIRDLSDQGERLSKLDTSLDQIQDNQVYSAEIIKSMRGYWSRMTSPFSKIPIIKTAPFNEPKKSHTIKSSHVQHVVPTSLLSDTATEQQHKLYIEGEMLLEQVSDSVGRLKGMATQMGTEIDNQNELLDHLNNRVTHSTTNIKRLNRGVRSV